MGKVNRIIATSIFAVRSLIFDRSRLFNKFVGKLEI
jgi:hypothetical protein